MQALIDGTKYVDSNGYERVKKQYVHRLVAERVLGRPLKDKELVHHVDGNKSNNSNSNLVICPNEEYHSLIHARQRIVEMGGNPDKDKYCTYHDTLHSRELFSTRPSAYDGLHNMCREATNTYRKENGHNASKFGWKERLNQQYRRVFRKYTNREICKV